MSNPAIPFQIKPRRRWPWLIAVVIVLALLAALGWRLERSQQPVVFGSTLQVHFEPAMAGEERIIQYVGQHIAPDYGIELQAVGLQDGSQADRAVAEGKFAATIYQHQWWLKQVVDANGFDLKPLLPVFQWGFGLYSLKYKHVKDLPDGAVIAVPNDGANQGQALWLLERIGLITLNPRIEARVARLRDIGGNPHHYQFKELDLLSMPRVLNSVDVAIGYVSQFDAGKVPRSAGILFPPAPQTFASQLVVGGKFVKDAQIIKLQQAFADPRLKHYLETTDDPLVKGVLTPVSDK
jgi:ABC-type metal ion transport system substrate-binding protein